MNVLDIENGSRLASVSGNFISADKVKQGTKVCIGTDDSALFDIMNEKVIPILVLVDKEKYNEIKNQETRLSQSSVESGMQKLDK